MFLLEHPFLGQFSFERLPLVLQHLADLTLQARVLDNSPWEEDFEKHMRSWVPSTAAIPALSLLLAWGGSCHPGGLPSSEDSRYPENQPGGGTAWGPGPPK